MTRCSLEGSPGSDEQRVGEPGTSGESGKSDSHSNINLNVHDDGSYLITGGLGGLGLQVARYLAEQGARHLVLCGRREQDEIDQSSLKEIGELGVSVHYIRTDVSERNDVVSLFEAMSDQFPPLKGIIHAAGFLQDGLIADQDWENFSSVFGPKVHGSWYLHEMSQALELDFFVLFSSVASLLSPPYQANHSAANAFLDTLAHFRQSRGLPATTINWGIWSEVGSAAEKQSDRQMQRFGVGSFPPEAGIKVFDQVIRSLPHQIAVMPMVWDRYFDVFPTLTRLGFYSDILLASEKSQSTDEIIIDSTELEELAAQIATANQEDCFPLYIEYLRSLFAAVLKMEAGEIDTGKALQNMGLDSLMAVELRNRITKDLNRDVPMVRLMEGATVLSLAEFCMDAEASDSIERVEVVATNEMTEEERLLDRVDDLSEEEIEELLKTLDT
ncbi:MAG: SDR family NAD(P)-dependent oxidoreductase [Gammaproteobacteria bacterium]|nr:SDR family NAD(P)-dependent oxidoreductase [Gammaproteobacteria bacterium]